MGIIFTLLFGFKTTFLSVIDTNVVLNQMDNDTITIAAAKNGFTLRKGEEEIIVTLKFETSTQTKLSNSYLLLEYIVAEPLPEGVYELYLSSYCPGTKHKLKLKEEKFIGIMDLYNLSIPGNSQSLIFQITGKNKSIIAKKRKGECCYLIIKFNGNRLMNGKVVIHNGNLLCGSARLVQF